MDTKDKYYNHDFARIFAQDIYEYLERGGTVENISATNVFNVINGENEEDDFTFTKNVVTYALTFRSEDAQEYYLIRQIKIQEEAFAFDKETLPEMRKQIVGDKEYGRWDIEDYIRYFTLISNINIMSYRGTFKEMGDISNYLKSIYMFIDLWKEGVKNGKAK